MKMSRSHSGSFAKLVGVFLFTITCISAFSIGGLERRAHPGSGPLRQKRSGISDQRLAELETLLALTNMRGKVVTVPVAYGIIDPDRIGKRKRSFDDLETVPGSSSSIPLSTSSSSPSAFVEKILRRLKQPHLMGKHGEGEEVGGSTEELQTYMENAKNN